jgi:hypothetical protein
MSRLRGRSLESFYNRVYRPSCTLDTILPRSSFTVVSRPAGSLHVMARLGKSMSTSSSLKSTERVGCSDSESSFKCSSKCSFHLASTWFLLVNSSSFLARHIATCDSNERLTSLESPGYFDVAQSRLKPLRRAALPFF